MTFQRWNIGWLGWFALLAATAPVTAQESGCPAEGSTGEISRIPLEAIAPVDREKVRLVLERPTMATGGQPEMFLCNPEHYHWLVEHPDQATRLWRCLGIKCA